MGLFPGYLYSLESRGILPERPRGTVSTGYAKALIEHRLKLGLPLPPDTAALLEQIAAAER